MALHQKVTSSAVGAGQVVPLGGAAAYTDACIESDKISKSLNLQLLFKHLVVVPESLNGTAYILGYENIS